MSLQGIHGTTAATPVATAANENDSTGVAPRRSRVATPVAAAPAAASDGSQSQPAPLRFPWLSRLSTLAAAAKTPTTFAAPILGDNLDKQA